MRRSQTAGTGGAVSGKDDADDDDLIVVDMTAAGQGVVVAPVVHPAAERSPSHVSVIETSVRHSKKHATQITNDSKSDTKISIR